MSEHPMTLLAAAPASWRGENPPPVFLAFMIVWGCLGLGSYLFFHLNRNAALKRKIWPTFVIVIGLIFGGFAYFIMGRQQPHILYMAVPGIVIISFLNIRTTRFCDSCGRTLYRQPVFSRQQFCSHCGAQSQ